MIIALLLLLTMIPFQAPASLALTFSPVAPSAVVTGQQQSALTA